MVLVAVIFMTTIYSLSEVGVDPMVVLGSVEVVLVAQDVLERIRIF